jgi:hypothetical protein
MKFKTFSLLAIVAALCVVKIQAVDPLLEEKARKLIGVNPTDQQCVIHTQPPDDTFDAPILLERKQYHDEQVKGGRVRSVDFSNTAGNLKSTMKTMEVQDLGAISWFSMDGFGLTNKVAFAFYQVDYVLMTGQRKTYLFKVMAGDDCFKFVEAAQLDPNKAGISEIMTQVFFSSGDPHRKRRLSSG